MPWIEFNKMDQRLQFVIRSLDPKENFTNLCREFNISAKTGYKWKLINNRGCTNYRGHRIFIGNAFNGYSIGILKEPEHQSRVFFNKLLLGAIDRRNFFFTPEKNLRQKVLPMY